MLFDDGLNYRSVFLQVGIYIFYIDFSHGIDRWLGLSMQPLHGRFLDLRLDLGDTRLNVSLSPSRPSPSWHGQAYPACRVP